MATSLQIKCIHKSDRPSAHERITHVGGTRQDGSRWSYTQEQAVQGIKNGALSFYVERPVGHRVAVIVGRSAAGHEYIKTESDGEQPNNLLALPECVPQ
jgi:hypothetical protein